VIDADLAFMRDRLPPGARLLDVGAGRGSFVKEARRRGFAALALEMDPGAISLWSQERVPGLLGSGAMTPFVDGCFDVVRMKEVLEHVEAPLTLVLEARRLLRPHGLFIFHTPTPYSQLYPVGNFWDDYTHVRPFSRAGLRRLIADAGLQLARVDSYVSGRNAVERALGRLLAHVFPHMYRGVAWRDGQ
jgi:SAM-dependent methyltransferase